MSVETLVVFHRCGGKSLGYPPNTILTAEWALEQGAKAIEYDVVLTKNGDTFNIVAIEPKLLKQASLDINNLDAADVRKIDTGNEKFGGSNPVSLEEMLRKIDTSKVAHQIHIKSNHPKIIEELLARLRGITNYMLTTFDIEVIKKIKGIDKNVPVGWIVKPKQEKGAEGLEDLTAVVTANADALEAYTDAELDKILKEAKENSVNIVILCGPRIQTKETIQKVRDAGFQVGAWGVGTNLDIARRLIEYEIDRFTLDNPEQL